LSPCFLLSSLPLVNVPPKKKLTSELFAVKRKLLGITAMFKTSIKIETVPGPTMVISRSPLCKSAIIVGKRKERERKRNKRKAEQNGDVK
jgi:hypothetical protein